MPYPEVVSTVSVSPTVRAWEQLSSRTLVDVSPWMKVHEDTIRLPGGRVIEDFYRIETPDYVIMAVCDAAGRFLLERQYKHGIGAIILTSPSGGIEPGERPIDAAKRELLEETGYQAERWSFAGRFLVDGTRGICWAYFFIARDISRTCCPQHSDIETCETVFLTPQELVDFISDGSICLLPDITLYSLVLGPLLSGVKRDVEL